MRKFVFAMLVMLSSAVIAQYGGPGECPDDDWGNDPIRERAISVYCREVIEIYDEFGIPINTFEYEGSKEECAPTADPTNCASWMLDPYCVPSIP